MQHSYWRKQEQGKALFPDIEWSKPERRDQAGKLGIIGGNKLGFAGAAEAYGIASTIGIGQARVLLPDALRKTIPTTMTDVIFGASNPSGSLASSALQDMQVLSHWADSILLIGDTGRNSETAITYEQFLANYQGQLTITRDAADLLKNSAQLLVERDDTVLVVAFAQLQKIFQAVYYPKILTFSMQLTLFVEALHKFTITYPCTIVTLHKEQLLIASKGEVITQQWDEPMAIWRGTTATRAACYWLWNPSEVMKAVATSLY